MGSVHRIMLVGVCLARLAAGQDPDDSDFNTPDNGGDSYLAAMRGNPQEAAESARRPAFISGKVSISDGRDLPGPVLIERVCSANILSAEGYTDLKGRFNLNLGQPLNTMADASGRGAAASSGSDAFADCEVRARLAGFGSSSISLSGHRVVADNPNIGTIVLTPERKNDGQFFSGTSASAPKEARKAFEKATSNFTKKKFTQAEKQFRQAATLHPKYTDAWLGLGKTYVALRRPLDARNALLSAIAADPNYVYPYEQLYLLAFTDGNWEELANTTERVLRLDPYEFPDAYYYNGVANLKLKNWESARKSLIAAIQADQRSSNAKAYYVLGLVLVGKKDFAGAADNLEEFTRMAPADPQVGKARAILTEIAKVLRPAPVK